MSTKYKFYVFIIRWNMPIIMLATMGILAVALFALKGTPMYEASPFIPVLGGAAVLGLFYMALKSLIKKGLKDINGTLNDKCDPDAFIKLCRFMISKAPAGSAAMAVQRLNLGSGLLAAGRFEDALDTLIKVGTLSLLYMYNMCLALCGTGRFEDAKEYLDKYGKAISSINFKTEEQKAAGKQRLSFLKSVYSAEQGDFGKAESGFAEALDTAQNEYGRVTAKYYLGRAYMSRGDAASAKEAFEYASQHGNKLYAAQQSRELLQQLEGTSGK